LVTTAPKALCPDLLVPMSFVTSTNPISLPEVKKPGLTEYFLTAHEEVNNTISVNRAESFSEVFMVFCLLLDLTYDQVNVSGKSSVRFLLDQVDSPVDGIQFLRVFIILVVVYIIQSYGS